MRFGRLAALAGLAGSPPSLPFPPDIRDPVLPPEPATAAAAVEDVLKSRRCDIFFIVFGVALLGRANTEV